MQRRALILLAFLIVLGVATFGMGSVLRTNANAAKQNTKPVYESEQKCDNPDGRVNVLCTPGEGAQTTAIYCSGDGNMSFRGYVTPPGVWPLVLTVSKAQIEAAGVPKALPNILIAESHGVRVYRLVGGGFQINSVGLHGTDYVFPKAPNTWMGCIKY